MDRLQRHRRREAAHAGGQGHAAAEEVRAGVYIITTQRETSQPP